MSLALLATLIVLSALHLLAASRLRRAVNAARRALNAGNAVDTDGADVRHITGERLMHIQKRFKELKNARGPRRRLAIAWEEFNETAIPPSSESDRLRNTVRPVAFFHRDELGLDRGMWRQVPAMFVSVGLFLTFLGLVAALDQTGVILGSVAARGDGTPTEALEELLNIASTKFIMSLTGLLCSIFFTLVLRLDARRMDGALSALCDDIEKGCTYLGEQTILGELLEQAREQTDHLKSFSTELVAQVATPLREDLPNTIREAMQQAMVPVVENITQGTNDGVESLVGSVSNQLIEGIRGSVLSMNEVIGEVRGSLEAVTDRLDRSAGAMGVRMDEAVQSLASTSADGARRISEASRMMAEGAEALSRFVEQSVTMAADASGRKMEQAGQAMVSGVVDATATMRDSLLDPMTALVESIRGLASGVESATGRVGEYAHSVENSGTAISSTNEGLKRSADTLITATEPIRDVVVGIASAIRTMGDSVETASAVMRQTTEHTEIIMRGAREAVDASRSAMLDAAGSLERAATEFGEVIDRYGVIDQRLGDAFEKIETSVRSSIDEIGTFERKLNEEFGLALNRLQAVIAQIEPFVPRREE